MELVQGNYNEIRSPVNVRLHTIAATRTDSKQSLRRITIHFIAYIVIRIIFPYSVNMIKRLSTHLLIHIICYPKSPTTQTRIAPQIDVRIHNPLTRSRSRHRMQLAYMSILGFPLPPLSSSAWTVNERLT